MEYWKNEIESSKNLGNARYSESDFASLENILIFLRINKSANYLLKQFIFDFEK